MLSAESGWEPQYQTVYAGEQLLAACPLFCKTNSYGEYIFDWAWADAYRRYGIQYYPKLVASTPFTPATGAKLLFRSGSDRESLARELLAAAKAEADRQNCSSLHYLFLAHDEAAFFESADFFLRHSFQYHWENPGYASFDDFLGRLKPKRRKQIQRERTQLKETGLDIRVVTAEELSEEDADLFFRFYARTIAKMQAIPYLNRAFFRRVFAAMRENITLVLAEDRGEPLAGALFFHKGRHLYGRYWGALADVRHLHFELCYYRPIEWAIERGVTLFEAGAQGEHKIARGFVPKLTLSAHWIRRPDFRAAIAGFIAEEKAAIKSYFAELSEHDPYL